MFAVGFPEVGNAAFHLSDEILYPVVRRPRSFTRFFPDKASQRKTDDLRAAATGAPRKRLDPLFQFRSQAYGQLARHAGTSFVSSSPMQCNLTTFALHRQTQYVLCLHGVRVELESGLDRDSNLPAGIVKRFECFAWWRRSQSTANIQPDHSQEQCLAAIEVSLLSMAFSYLSIEETISGEEKSYE
jgi:hypothetical protein